MKTKSSWSCFLKVSFCTSSSLEPDSKEELVTALTTLMCLNLSACWFPACSKSALCHLDHGRWWIRNCTLKREWVQSDLNIACETEFMKASVASEDNLFCDWVFFFFMISVGCCFWEESAMTLLEPEMLMMAVQSGNSPYFLQILLPRFLKNTGHITRAGWRWGGGQREVNINCPVNVLHFHFYCKTYYNFLLIANSRYSDIALD